MASRIYSVHDTSIALTGSGSATYELAITVPATNVFKAISLDVSGDFDSATDDPVLVEFLRASAASSGTSVTPSLLDTGHGLASGATVLMDGVSATPVSNSVVFAKRVRVSYSWRPGVTMQPGEIWVCRMTPGAQDRNMDLSFFWEE